jgi:hypothetical protein
MKNQVLRLRRAIDLLHKPGTRLMLMHGRDGDEFYLVPGGRLDTRCPEDPRTTSNPLVMGCFPATLSNGA